MKTSPLSQIFVATAVLAAIAVIVGCGQNSPPPADRPPASKASGAQKDHDPDDVAITEADVKMPANYADAIARLKAYRDTIRTNIEAGTPTKAHRSLDEQNIVLNKLPQIARDSGVPKTDWEAVNVTAKDLRALFDQLHEAIDAQRKPDYAAVADKIEAALKKLEGLTPDQKPESP